MINKSNICKAANGLVGRGYSRREAFRQAWALAKEVITKVAGVSFGSRPVALKRLAGYRPERISVKLIREEGNVHSASAVAVIATVEGKGSYRVGYIPAETARVLSQVMDKGAAVKAAFKAVTGGWFAGQSYGMRIAVGI